LVRGGGAVQATGPRIRTIHTVFMESGRGLCAEIIKAGLVRGRLKWLVLFGLHDLLFYRGPRLCIPRGSRGANEKSIEAPAHSRRREFDTQCDFRSPWPCPGYRISPPGAQKLRSENWIIQNLNGERWRGINAFFVHSMMIDKL